MKFQPTVIQINILKQCSMGFRNKLSNLCKSVNRDSNRELEHFELIPPKITLLFPFNNFFS